MQRVSEGVGWHQFVCQVALDDFKDRGIQFQHLNRVQHFQSIITASLVLPPSPAQLAPHGRNSELSSQCSRLPSSTLCSDNDHDHPVAAITIMIQIHGRPATWVHRLGYARHGHWFVAFKSPVRDRNHDEVIIPNGSFKGNKHAATNTLQESLPGPGLNQV